MEGGEVVNITIVYYHFTQYIINYSHYCLLHLITAFTMHEVLIGFWNYHLIPPHEWAVSTPHT